MYLGSNISSTEIVNACIDKIWTATERLTTTWKYVPSDRGKIKILQSSSHHLEKKVNGETHKNPPFKKSWKKYLTKHYPVQPVTSHLANNLSKMIKTC